jgi:hypothetical protein
VFRLANVRVVWERVFGAVAPWVKVVLPGVMTDIAQGEVVVVSFNRLAEWHESLAARSFAVLTSTKSTCSGTAENGARLKRERLNGAWSAGCIMAHARTEAAL